MIRDDDSFFALEMQKQTIGEPLHKSVATPLESVTSINQHFSLY